MRPILRRIAVIAALFALAPSFSDVGAAWAKPPKKSAKDDKKKKPTEIKMPKTDDAAVEEASTDTSSTPPPTRGPTRIDFDDRLIQGQTNKSGAVYLYDRKELKTRSMIKTRDSFREEIVTTVYDD